MLLDEIKQKLNPFLLVIGRKTAALGLTPNLSTGIGFLFLLAALVLLYQKQVFYAGIALTFQYLFDKLDGSIALATKRETKMGAFLDYVVDQNRSGVWIVAGLKNLLPLEVAIIALFLDTFGSLLARLVQITGVKTIRWFPSWMGWLLIPALITEKLLPFTWIFIIAQGVALLLHVGSIFVLNREKA